MTPESPPTSTVSVWMVNFNSALSAIAAIDRLLEHEATSVQVYDNASRVEDRDLLRSRLGNTPRVTLHFGDRNLGFGAAMNRLARLDQSGTEYVWLVNPDTLLLAGSAQYLIEKLSNRPPAIISPLIVSGALASPVIWFAGGSVDLRIGVVRHINFGAPPPAPSTPTVSNTDFMTGAAPFMARRTFLALGGFDESLFLYWEDVELSLRAVRDQVPLLLDPAVQVWHREGGSGDRGEGSISHVAMRYMVRNRLWVCRRAGANRIRLLFSAGSFGAMHLLRLALVGPGKTKAIVSFLRASLEGLIVPPPPIQLLHL